MFLMEQVESEKLAWKLAEQHGLELVTIHPATALGTVYTPDLAGSFSVEEMKVRHSSCSASVKVSGDCENPAGGVAGQGQGLRAVRDQV